MVEATVELKEVADLCVLGVRFRTSIMKIQGDVGAGFKVIYAYLDELGQPPAGPHLALYYGEMLDPADFEMELCVPVGSLPDSRGEVVARVLQGGLTASTMHRGPYDRVKEAYDRLDTWIRDNGYRCAGPAREIYWNDPSRVPGEELLTEVQFPVEGPR